MELTTNWQTAIMTERKIMQPSMFQPRRQPMQMLYAQFEQALATALLHPISALHAWATRSLRRNTVADEYADDSFDWDSLYL